MDVFQLVEKLLDFVLISCLTFIRDITFLEYVCGCLLHFSHKIFHSCIFCLIKRNMKSRSMFCF